MSDLQHDQTRAEARRSFTGSRLTDSQFDEAWSIAGILNREIHKSGSFVEKLADFSHAFARSQRFDAAKGEVILRDLHTARFGQSLNQVREGLMAREAVARDVAGDQALHHARAIPEMIKDGPTMPFYQAADRAGIAMARQHGITETGARKMMAEAFEAAEGRPLRAVGKEMEARHHQPVREAERAARQAERSRVRSGPQR
ncbi:MAG: hypothetical protein AAF376_19985 [Pseudomonadota bacterium]